MFSQQVPRVSVLALLFLSLASGFSTLPSFGVTRTQQSRNNGLLQSSCKVNNDPSAEASGRPLSALSRRDTLLPLVLAPFVLAQPAFAADNDVFKDELAGSDGKTVEVSFTFPKSWRLEQKPGRIVITDERLALCAQDPDKCDFGEIIARSIATGDNALVLAKNTDKDVASLPTEFFKKTIFSRGGKFGAYGAPEDVKFVEDKTEGGKRTLVVKWQTFTPGGSTLSKRSLIQAQSAGPDLYLLVVTSTANRFKSSEPLLREIAASLHTTPTGKAAVEQESSGVRKSMFLKDNVERAQLEKARAAEGIQ